jgi:hypothetical protein
LTLALGLSTPPVLAQLAPTTKVETSRIASGYYAQRRQAITEQVRPKDGYQTRLVLGVLKMDPFGVLFAFGLAMVVCGLVYRTPIPGSALLHR